ncbi:hypothetical protein MESS4_380024 [Mesorhizobium sp. STM 4661]|nr:hypothetical protein MESS4_380024 [Mesorhizobium sp. STM 4661]
MRGMLDEDHLIDRQRLVDDAGMRPRQIEDADIEQALGHLVDRQVRETALEPQRNVRPPFAHPGDPGRGDAVPQIGRSGQPEQRLIAVGNGDVLSRLLPGASDRGGMRQELPPCRGKRDAIAVANEKPASQLLFQAPDPRADGGLGKVEPVGRDSEAAMGGNLEKAAQIFGVHLRPLASKISMTPIKKYRFPGAVNSELDGGAPTISKECRHAKAFPDDRYRPQKPHRNRKFRYRRVAGRQDRPA